MECPMDSPEKFDIPKGDKKYRIKPISIWMCMVTIPIKAATFTDLLKGFFNKNRTRMKIITTNKRNSKSIPMPLCDSLRIVYIF